MKISRSTVHKTIHVTDITHCKELQSRWEWWWLLSQEVGEQHQSQSEQCSTLADVVVCRLLEQGRKKV